MALPPNRRPKRNRTPKTKANKPGAKPPSGRKAGRGPAAPIRADVSRGRQKRRIFVIPRGYLPPRETKDEAAANITYWLEALAMCVRGTGFAEPRVRVKINRDESVDGQIDVEEIKRTRSVYRLLFDIEECFDGATAANRPLLARDYFIQGGLDYKRNEGGHDTPGERFKGIARYDTYWYRAANFFEMFQSIHTRNKNSKRVRGGGKAKRIWVRFHWNIANLSPAHTVKRQVDPEAKGWKKKAPKKSKKG